jgi:hypothetical protein
MPQGTDIGMRASAGAGVTTSLMDVPNSVKESATEFGTTTVHLESGERMAF